VKEISNKFTNSTNPLNIVVVTTEKITYPSS